MQLEAPFKAQERFGYGAASLTTAMGDDVHLAFLRGPVTTSVIHQVAADVGHEIKERDAFASVLFFDRCVVTVQAEDLYEAAMTQVMWARLTKPAAIVCRPENRPTMMAFAERMASHGIVCEVFMSRDAFAALAWAKARASAARRQATYLSRTSNR